MVKYSDKEIQYIKSKSDVMNALIERYGHLDMGHLSDVYESLVIHIISQMLANNVASAIIDCLVNKVHDITPESVSKLSIDEFRECGIARKKGEYILELSKSVISGKYDFSLLEQMADKEVIEYLTQIKGVGIWTAEMIAEFTLGRLDIFSYSDIALQNGIKKAHNFKTLSQKRFEALRKKYSPYCSVASLYYYVCNDDKDFERIILN